MPPTKRLRAVAADEKPAAKKSPATVAQAVESGSRRDELVAMRTRIARAIDDPNIRGADLAALSRRLLEIGKEIEAIDTAAEQEDRDANPSPDEAFDSSAI